MQVRVWRAAHGDGNGPPELQGGFLIERFNKLPHELGLTSTNDTGYLYRALDAVHVWRCAKKYQTDWGKDIRSISDEEWRTISRMTKAIRAQEGAVSN